jgi:hypothetical protein
VADLAAPITKAVGKATHKAPELGQAQQALKSMQSTIDKAVDSAGQGQVQQLKGSLTHSQGPPSAAA